mmetsp:Transcript_19596/g.48469  ORF Transcript_19596/g.48469 Transcript_19596/m.48469 type:complete len:215 (+) Transcript_19596:533-1177(+)
MSQLAPRARRPLAPESAPKHSTPRASVARWRRWIALRPTQQPPRGQGRGSAERTWRRSAPTCRRPRPEVWRGARRWGWRRRQREPGPRRGMGNLSRGPRRRRLQRRRRGGRPRSRSQARRAAPSRSPAGSVTGVGRRRAAQRQRRHWWRRRQRRHPARAADDAALVPLSPAPPGTCTGLPAPERPGTRGWRWRPVPRPPRGAPWNARPGRAAPG